MRVINNMSNIKRLSMKSNYELEIISHHPKFAKKNLRKFSVDGIETVGAWGGEPFEIKFKNNTYKKVQVKISVDGTDILTGSLANTEVSKNMWVVDGNSSMSLRAWPENTNGGAAFVFTGADKSVAAHTHGNLSNRGIIAAAVYVEGYSEPILLDRYRLSGNLDYSLDFDEICERSDSRTFSSDSIGSRRSKEVKTHSNLKGDVTKGISKTLEKLVSVGAGQHVDQKITYVTGLIKPVLAETLKVKYLWWSDLKAKLKEADVDPSGFPGDNPHKIMSIRTTPRIKNSFRKMIPQSISRF